MEIKSYATGTKLVRLKVRVHTQVYHGSAVPGDGAGGGAGILGHPTP